MTILHRKTAMAISLPFIFFLFGKIHAQQMDTHYQQLPKPPKTVNGISVLKRQVQGLGFRYYWGTEGLTPNELQFRTTREARTVRETLEHIYFLCVTVQNTVSQTDANRFDDVTDVSWEALRAATLVAIKAAEQHLETIDENALEEQDVIFASGLKTDFRFLYLINGPLSDALTHVGQVVSFRRAAGNPQPKGVNVFTGIKKEN